MSAAMTQDDVERIARSALKDLGANLSNFAVTPVTGRAGQFRIDIRGASKPILITCSAGSSPQWVRSQICDKYLAQH
jgi:hypothetical protein